jgi:hypothetical protein
MQVGTMRIPLVPKDHRTAAISACAALFAGLTLRLLLFKNFFEVNGDALIYGGLAKNILLHGRYALTTGNGETYFTLIRLPGYPLFLAACFRLFGMENYASAAWVQIAVELLGCLLLADFARRIAKPQTSDKAALIALWLAALCPFTAIYAAQPLTEALTLFSISLALWSAARFRESARWPSALLFASAASFAGLLRPDGVLLGVALAPALLIAARQKIPTKQLIRITLVCSLLALAPIAAWTLRNWKVFHVFEPLAPRYANDPGEDIHPGWQHWMKTWCLDFNSTYDVYWAVPESPLDFSKLPSRAFDSPAQRQETEQLVADYNNSGMELTPEIDARFQQLARERSKSHPLRSDLWLPLGRLADMTLRPRVENLPIDLDWWVYSHHHSETRFSWSYAALNFFYLFLALAGLFLRPKLWPWMLLYLALRSLLLMTIEAPEARYTLEFFPIFFALGGVFLASSLSLNRARNWVPQVPFLGPGKATISKV